MSIRLAAGKPLAPLQPERATVRRMLRNFANDNRAMEATCAPLDAALRHFARHGLAAAEQALIEAEAAATRGDETGATCWRDICAVLDRRLLDRRLMGQQLPDRIAAPQ